MPLHKSAYAGVWLYLPEACSRDEDAVVRDITLVMDNLKGDELRMALKHTYEKWGDYSTEACEDFIAELVMFREALWTPLRTRRRSKTATPNEVRQGSLF